MYHNKNQKSRGKSKTKQLLMAMAVLPSALQLDPDLWKLGGRVGYKVRFEDLSDAYEEDVERIERMPDVNFISP